MANWTEEELLKKLEENPSLKIATDVTRRTTMANKAPKWTCACGKYQGKKYRGITCDRCGAKVKWTGKGKYHSTRTVYNGILYHSRKESEFARRLDNKVEMGEIDFWLRQVPFRLAGGIIYRADFVTFGLIAVEEIGGKPIRSGLWCVTVYEVKGYKTKEWIMKEKLFRERYPNLILEVV